MESIGRHLGRLYAKLSGIGEGVAMTLLILVVVALLATAAGGVLYGGYQMINAVVATESPIERGLAWVAIAIVAHRLLETSSE